MDNKELLKCRTCLEEIENSNTNEYKYYNLFEPWKEPWDGMGINIAEDVEKLTQIHIDEEDTLSKTVCLKCAVKFRDLCVFVKFVRDNDKTLKLSVQKCELDDTIVVKEEIKSDTEEDGSTNWLEGYTIDNVDVKTEQEEHLDNYDNDMNIIDDNSFSLCKNELNGSHSLDGLPVKEEHVDDELADGPVTCVLCSKTYNSESGLKAHVMALHSYHTISKLRIKQKPPQNGGNCCKLCKKTFPTPTDLMVHEAESHESPKCFKCKKYFTNFQQLSRHSRRCRFRKNRRPKLVTLDDVRRSKRTKQKFSENANDHIIYKCLICNDIFTDELYLKIHQEAHAAS